VPTPLPKKEVVPSKPFRILDAPFLRDDFYCSTLAYSTTSAVLAVGLGHEVYLWSEGRGLAFPPFPDLHQSNYVTSLSFSSENGERSVLAVARRSGQLTLWSTFEKHVRFEISHPCTLTCVAFKPKTSRRPSERFGYMEVDVEELVAGDELGNIWYYSVEWSDEEDQAKWKWNGSMTLLAKICAHTQQICGLAWSPDEKYLASGGNDNACLLFELAKIVPPRHLDYTASSVPSPDTPSSFSLGAFPYFALGPATRRMFSRRPALNHIIPSWVTPPLRPSSTAPALNYAGTLISGGGRTILVPFNSQKHRLVHSAAVKAIAFAPWQPSLLATGGGTNDRAIHFYHTRSGACLATINVFAQVTSLIWSETRREIVATFGYAQPDHPFRIAVFAWPSCAQVAVIPWGPYGSSWDGPGIQSNFDCGRALCAIRYPGKLPRSFGVPFGSQSSSGTPSPVLTRSSEEGSTRRRKSGPRVVTPKEKEGGMWCARTKEEGCIIIASSDQTVKFHEVWAGRKTSMSSGCGLLGGSDILEGLEGIEKSSGEVIR
jgi:WD40 repeat protein